MEHDHSHEGESFFAHKWEEFWHVFWNFGHASSEIAWEIISTVVTVLIVMPLLRRHDRRHHHHVDHSDDEK